VFQNYALYPHMTIFDNMAFGLKLAKKPKDFIEKTVNKTANTQIHRLRRFKDSRP